MVKRALVIAALAAGAPAPAQARTAVSTSYCLTGIMADGTRVRAGSVAMNRHPLGTHIRLLGSSFQGRRRFTVRDRIGYGSDMDLWSPTCAGSFAWGRRTVRYRLGW